MIVQVELPEPTMHALRERAGRTGVSVDKYIASLVTATVRSNGEIEAFTADLLARSRPSSLRREPTGDLHDQLHDPEGTVFDEAAWRVMQAEFDERVKEIDSE